MLDIDVPGRSDSSGEFLVGKALRDVVDAVDGRRPASKGPGAMVFIRCNTFEACLFGLLPEYMLSTP